MAEKKRHHHSEMKHHSAHHERRMHEMREAGMISEDKSAVANMPQGVMYRPWPSANYDFDHSQDDTISGINSQIREDESVAKRHNKPSKW